MVTLALRIGNSDIQIVTGSASDWLHVLFALTLSVCAFAILGAVIGVIFRRRIVLQVLTSIIVSSGIVAYFLVREGWLSSKYSLQEKIDGLQEVAGVYLLCWIAPIVLASLFVSQWLLRRKTI